MTRSALLLANPASPQLPTLRIRDLGTEASSSRRHTLAGSPTGNLPTTLSERDTSR